MADLEWGRVVNIGGGFLLVALGAWVATRRPFRRENLAFAAYTFLGLASALYNLSVLFEDEEFTRPYAYAATTAFALAGVGAVLVARWFPTPMTAADRRTTLVALLIGAMVTIGLGIPSMRVFLGIEAWESIIAAPRSSPVHLLWAGMSLLYYGAVWFALAVFPQRLRTSEPRHATAYLLIACALVLYPAFNLPVQHDAVPWSRAMPALATCAAAVAVAALWLISAQQGPRPRAARNVAWLTLALPVAGLAIGGVAGGYEWLVKVGAFGLLRVASVTLLAYAILKHQLLGIDVKVRFAISKSTIAAIFIAVFFVASEVAQQFFSEKTSSTYIGIGIAGTLVFAMAPIQRAAERIAEKAVPVTSPTGTTIAPSSRESSYLDAVRLALRDRRLTRSEESKLHGLAEQLGIGARRAHEILVQAESEAEVA